MSELLQSQINPLILVLCLVTGYLIKHWLRDVDNKIIPTVVTAEGIILALWLSHWQLTPQILASGALTGLASTGAHQLFKQWLDQGAGQLEK